MGKIGKSIFDFHAVLYDDVVQGETAGHEEKY